MRIALLTITAVAAIMSAPALMPAQAMTLGTAPGVRAAIEETSAAQDVVYVCRHRRWTSARGCWWRPGYRFHRWHWRRRWW
jgi:hypothetical protein